ncbi:MAG TPA: hypothetical protein VMG10_34915 [Gemmataceae bacterium]|nr:hypothetical protein [Gemmataceae bacterium]
MRYFHDVNVTEVSAGWAGDGKEDKEQPSQRSSRRRGATAMEYLFVISLILCAAITGIGYFGQSTKDTMQKSSDAVGKATNNK